MIEGFLRGLRQPEYVHTLLNPLPVYGLAIALVGLVVGLLLRSRSAQLTALVLILISAASVWPVVHFGERAEDNILALADDDGRAWLEAHATRADQLQYIFYVLAAASLAALVAPKKWPKSALPLTLVVMVLAICSLGAGASIAYAGGKIRHREFRTVAPPGDAHER